MAKKDGTDAYIGVDANGIVAALVVDLGDETTAETVAEFIRDGMTVHHTKRHTAADALFERWQLS